MSTPGVYLFSTPSAESVRAGLPPYAAAWGLHANPFPVTPDETHYFFTPETEAIYEELSHFIEMRKGFLLFTGDIGLGKTTLLRRLLGSFDKAHYNTALILTSFLDQSELLETIARDFGLPLPATARRIDHLAALNQFLMAESLKGKTNVLFVDDAQALDAQALDVVRQLSNLETAQNKLIQVVLCGQPELLDTLNQHSLRQVKSRIALHRQLQPLDREQTLAYIQHRMAKAGAVKVLEISDDALQSLHDCTAGFPRRIHHLMDRCLYALMISGEYKVDRALVQRALNDLGWQAQLAAAPPKLNVPLADESSPARRAWWRRQVTPLWLLMLLLAVVALASWLVVADRRMAATPAGPATPPPSAAPVMKPLAAVVPVVVPAPFAIAAPVNWSAALTSFKGLAGLDWPSAGTTSVLTEKLQQSLEDKPWQAVLAQGEWVTQCSERPMLVLNDAQGNRWYLSFIESLWPTAPAAMGLHSDSVRQLQRLLSTRGWLEDADVDATMGPRTAMALAQFQREQGITGTGQFSQDTAYRLSCWLAHDALAARSAVR